MQGPGALDGYARAVRKDYRRGGGTPERPTQPPDQTAGKGGAGGHGDVERRDGERLERRSLGRDPNLRVRPEVLIEPGAVALAAARAELNPDHEIAGRVGKEALRDLRRPLRRGVAGVRR